MRGAVGGSTSNAPAGAPPWPAPSSFPKASSPGCGRIWKPSPDAPAPPWRRSPSAPCWAAGPRRLLAPASDLLEQVRRVDRQLLQWSPVHPRHRRRHQPGTAAHLDHAHQRALMLKSDEGFGQVVRLGRGAPPSVSAQRGCLRPRRSPHSFSGRSLSVGRSVHPHSPMAPHSRWARTRSAAPRPMRQRRSDWFATTATSNAPWSGAPPSA